MKNYSQPIFAFIDDDTVFQFTAKILLTKKFHVKHILLFNNGKEAIDYIEQNKHNVQALPKVFFVDINMPIMNGWEFVERISAYAHDLFEDLDLYMVSSSIDQRDIDESKKHDIIKKFVSKPLTTDTFTKLLANRFEAYNSFVHK